MLDSKDFKDVESLHSGQLSLVPSKSASFPPKKSEETCLPAPKLCRLIFGIRSVLRETFLQVHLHILRHPIQGYPRQGTIQMQEEFPREPVRDSL